MVVRPAAALRVEHRAQAVLPVAVPQVEHRAAVVLPVVGAPAALSQPSVPLLAVARLP